MMFLGASDVIGVILDAIPRMFNIIWSILCAPIYYLISLFYNVFVTIPQINLLNDLKIEDIYQRITMIIVIVMAFYITFEVVKYVVQPDTITDKEKGSGKLVLRIVIVILMLAFIPRIFTIAYDLQARIINSDLISKVILGVKEDSESPISTRGSEFSADVFSLFYNLNTDACPLTEEGEIDGSELSAIDKSECELGKTVVDGNLALLRGGWTDNPATSTLMGPISALTQNFGLGMTVSSRDNDGDGKKDIEYIINFSGFLALGVGIFILWTLIVYGVEVAKRYFQLIYLQIIAPIAIMSYLSPKKDGVFSKWAKQCLTTYLDLFIRLSIINFVLLIIGLLHESFFDTSNVIEAFAKDFGITLRMDVLMWVYIFLIFGLFTFAKKAPKMLSELFPSSGAAAGSYGLSPKDNIVAPIKSIVGGTSRVIGGAVGAFTGANTALKSAHLKGSENKNDRLWSAAKGAFMGAKTGFSKGGNIKKANAAARGSVQKDEDIARSGGTVMDHDFKGGHYQAISKGYDRQIADLDDAIKAKGAVSSGAKETKVMKTTDSYMNEWAHRNIGNADTRGAALKQIEKATRTYAVSSRDDAAKTTYRNAITDAVNSVYEGTENKIISDFDVQKNTIQQELDAATTRHNEAITKVQYYESFVGPLTTEQLEDKENAIKMRDETTQIIATANETLTKIEHDKSIEIAKLEQEKQEVSAQIGDKVGADETVFDQVKVLIEEAKRVSKDVTYKNPTTGQEVRIDTTTNIQDFAKDIGDVADNAGLGKQIIESSSERRKAKANANESSGK